MGDADARDGRPAAARLGWHVGQKLVPELQPLISRINSADSAMLMTMEPRQSPKLCNSNAASTRTD